VGQQQAVPNSTDAFIDRLAEFFPGAVRMRIPVNVSKMTSDRQPVVSGTATIVFGTANEVLFTSELVLEFNDQVRVTNRDGSLDAQGKVVALQFGGKGTAVAVRFQAEVANWIIKPAPGKVER
jgi:hypothetical protein